MLQSAMTHPFKVIGLNAAVTNSDERQAAVSNASNIATIVAANGHRLRHANNTTTPKRISMIPMGTIALTGRPAC
jgi:hypothetical protein